MQNERSRCNFLVFVVDEMQSVALGCNGNPDVKTPNIDALASAGVSFLRAYCNNPVCMPSRATLLTGLTPRQHGCLTNGTILPERIPTVTAALAGSGYRTHAVGKLHLQPFNTIGGGSNPDFPVSREDRGRWMAGEIEALPDMYYGFQLVELVDGHVSNIYGNYSNWLNEHHPGMLAKYLPKEGYFRMEHAPMSWRMDVPAELHYNHWIADQSIKFLDSVKADEPFFLWCSFPDPHFPYAACKPYSEMYDPQQLTLNPTWRDDADELPCLAERRRQFASKMGFDEAGLREITAQTYGMITHIDDNIGRVVRHLEQKGLAGNTMIVFMADHGEYLGTHGLLGKAEWPYEELLRVPYVWKAPDVATAVRGKASVDIVSLLDFVPTVLDYAGIGQGALDIRGERHADRMGLPGRSLRPCLDEDKPLVKKPAIVEYDEDWHPGPVYRIRSIIDGCYKLTLFPAAGGGFLFNLDSDPLEVANLYNNPAYAAVKAKLLEKLLMELACTDRMDQPRICGA